MSNQHAIEEVHAVPQPAASYEAARTLSGAAEQEEQSALLRALLVRGISGAMNGIARDAAN